MQTFTFVAEDDQSYPNRYISPLVGFLENIVKKDNRQYLKRSNILSKKISQVKLLLDEIERLAKVTPDKQIGFILESLTSLNRAIDRAKPRLEKWRKKALKNNDEALEKSVGDSLSQLVLAQKKIKSSKAVISDYMGISRNIKDPYPYKIVLDKRYGLNLDEVKGWARNELDISVKNFESITRGLDSSKPALEVLQKHDLLYDTVEGLFKQAQKYLDIARDHTHKIMRLPKGERVEIVPLPEYMRSSYPWGAAGVGGRRTLVGKYALNPDNFMAVTKGWIQMMAIHECYPGHHTQSVKSMTSRVPKVFKSRMSRSVQLGEGVAHRAEEKYQDIFDDPIFPLFVAYRRMHTALRVVIELMTHTEGKTVDDAVKMYMDYMGFTEKSSLAQVHYQELLPGYMTCYYAGYLLVKNLEKESNLSEQEFNEHLYSRSMSPAVLRAHILG